ncbi:hypothetical protein [Flavobacterium sp. M31R6]|uniref:hypothetical protein n=1 Tax=Flavobacterium sp. M31R6 TaxID=2739062 RepID=UPI001568B45A|nr:hypothetical protein [Flavobacterium sp. M31R6]QKJ63228.1 hypothetical protein HQN62_08805 [Flavobacterium sp. M31R6]
MKEKIYLILSLLFVINSSAKCADNGFSVFPSNKKIKQNSIFVISGYYSSQDIIELLNKEYLVYLKSGNEKVNLIVTEFHKGQYNVSQSILKPERNLKIGLEYTLVIDSLPGNENLEKFNSETYKYEPFKFIVTNDIDNEKPTFTSKPIIIKNESNFLGCGISSFVVFNCPILDKSEYLVKATIRNIKSNKTSTYYINPYDGKISIGHGMCSGAFNLEDENSYEVEFEIMDASANYTIWNKEKIKFKKPKI